MKLKDMNKKYQWVAGMAVIVLVIAGGFLLFSPNEVIIQEEVEEEKMVEPATEVIFKETVEEVTLLRLPAGTDGIEIEEGRIVAEPLENNTIKRGELLGVKMVMEAVEGVFTVEANVLNEQEHEVVAIGRGFFPVEVTGGGLIPICCFETFETGNFNLKVTINGELAAELPFTVEAE